ncbi:hypothetical protein [Streptomyces sp. t39]|nr:hypothetical protein [Streptomyces sp. t39]
MSPERIVTAGYAVVIGMAFLWVLVLMHVIARRERRGQPKRRDRST